MPVGQKLLNLREYSRPALQGGDLQDALALLARSDIHTVPLAGGDTLVGSGDRSVEAVVDLQGLNLDRLELMADPSGLRIGALATRSALVDWPRFLSQPDGASIGQEELVRFLAQAARCWGGNVQRNRATAGGAVVVAANNDALVAALLVSGALLTLHSAGGYRQMTLAEFLPGRAVLLAEPVLITEIVVPFREGHFALETVARTPSDVPIVLAAAHVSGATAHLALGGVADEPFFVVLDESVEDASAIAERIAAELDPRGDFRGSAEYRRAMARVLAERVLTNARQGVR
jgi:CO/xanthine dehydrogenase FAD-binding subunit